MTPRNGRPVPGGPASVPAPAASWTFSAKVQFRTGQNDRKRLRVGEVPLPARVDWGRVPRVARLLALAYRFRKLVESGRVRDYPEVARVAGVTRPRVTQVMALLHLAPDIHEQVLGLPRVVEGEYPVTERELRGITAEAEWGRKRGMWQILFETESAKAAENLGGVTPRTSGR